jgi:hypothetical protein
LIGGSKRLRCAAKYMIKNKNNNKNNNNTILSSHIKHFPSSPTLPRVLAPRYPLLHVHGTVTQHLLPLFLVFGRLVPAPRLLPHTLTCGFRAPQRTRCASISRCVTWDTCTQSRWVFLAKASAGVGAVGVDGERGDLDVDGWERVWDV